MGENGQHGQKGQNGQNGQGGQNGEMRKNVPTVEPKSPVKMAPRVSRAPPKTTRETSQGNGEENVIFCLIGFLAKVKEVSFV